MSLKDVRRACGRRIRNFKRVRMEGVGHDFVGDIRSRLPHVKMRTIFDVGAHIGMTALEFSDEFPEATVHAFEPHPDNFARMKNNLIGKPDVLLYQTGMGAERGELPFHMDPEHPSMARVVEHGEKVTDIVPIDTIDHFCSENQINQIDLIKIDVEGHEIAVLTGAAETLRKGGISVIRIETAIDPDTPYHTQLWDLSELLHPFGYRIFGFYEQWESTLTNSPKLRRFDAAFIGPTAQTMRL